MRFWGFVGNYNGIESLAVGNYYYNIIFALD